MASQTDDDKVVKIRTNAPSQSRSAVLTGPWEMIAETRSAAGMSTSELARRARVSDLTVEAIESGAVERLPIGEAGIREVQSVCRVLRLEPGPYVTALKERRAAPLSSALVSQQPSQRRFSWLKIAIAVWVLVVGGAIAARILVSEDTGDSASSETTAEAVDSEPDPQTASETESAPSTAPETTAPPVSEPAGPAYVVRLTAARDDTWLAAVVNGEEQFVGTIPQGETREYVGDSIALTIGRPTEVDLVVNDAPQEPSRTVELG